MMDLNGYNIAQLFDKSMDVKYLSVSSYLKKGENTVSAIFYDKEKPHSLFLDGYFFSKNGELIKSISTDKSWECSNPETDLIEINSISDFSPAIRLARVSPSVSTRAKIMLYKGFVLFLCMGLFITESRIFIKRYQGKFLKRELAIFVATYTYLVPFLIFLSAYLFSRDVRIADALAYHPIIILSSLGILILSRIAICLEMETTN